MKPVLGRRWAVVAAASGTVVIGAGAFWLSFTALADLAVRSGIAEGQAWVWPILVDGLIVVATVAVVALDRHRSAWYPWTLLIAGALVSVTANAAHAIVAASISVPGVMAAIVASVPPLVLLASTHLTVILIRSTTPPLSNDKPELTEAADDEMPQLQAVGHPAAITAVPRTEAETAPEPEPEHLEPLESEPADPEPEPGPETQTPTPPQAASAESARSGKDADRRTRAEALREVGWSNKAIARELGVHASTVGRWFPRTPSTEEHTEGERS